MVERGEEEDEESSSSARTAHPRSLLSGHPTTSGSEGGWWEGGSKRWTGQEVYHSDRLFQGKMFIHATSYKEERNRQTERLRCFVVLLPTLEVDLSESERTFSFESQATGCTQKNTPMAPEGLFRSGYPNQT